MSTTNDNSTSCKAHNGPTDGPALDDDRTDTDGSDRLGRRTFVKGLGAAAAGGVAMGYDDGPVQNAEAVAPLVAAGILGAGVGAAGVVAYGALFEDDNADELESAQEYEAHLNLYNRTQESRLQLDETLASLQRDVQLVQNKAREEAIFRVWEAGVEGLDEAAAEDAAETAIQDAFATIQESILTSWTIRIERYASIVGTDLVPDDSEDVLFTWAPGVSESLPVGGSASDGRQFMADSDAWDPEDITLVDGTTMTYSGTPEGASNSVFAPVSDWDSLSDDVYSQLRVTVPDANDYEGVDEDTHDHTSEAVALDTEPWSKTYDDLMDEYDNMMDEVSSMVDTYFGPAQDGEIDLSTMRGPAHLSNTAENAEDFEEAALALRAMGYKLADQASTLSFEVEDDDGGVEEIEASGRLARTVNDPASLPVGTEIDPDIQAGSIYFAYNNRDENDDLVGGEITEISEPFTIVSASGADEVTFETRQLSEADHSLTAEEIAAIFEEHRQADDDARENVHDTATGGGGGLSGWWGGLSNTEKGVAAVVAAVFGYGALSN